MNVEIDSAELDELRRGLQCARLEREQLGAALSRMIEHWKAETLRAYGQAEAARGVKERNAWTCKAEAIERCVTELFGVVIGCLPGVQVVHVGGGGHFD